MRVPYKSSLICSDSVLNFYRTDLNVRRLAHDSEIPSVETSGRWIKFFDKKDSRIISGQETKQKEKTQWSLGQIFFYKYNNKVLNLEQNPIFCEKV